MSNGTRKAFVRQHGEIKTPPFTEAGRIEAGTLIGRLQDGESFGLPLYRPMPDIAPGVGELRVRDAGHNWRLMVCVDSEAVVLLGVFPKKTQKTPKEVINNCRRRLRAYHEARKAAGE